MKKFLDFKTNRFLIIACALTLIVSLLLGLLISQMNSHKSLANQDLTDLQRKIQRLNYYRPSPTKKNIEKIKEDIKYVENETLKLEEFFGAVYYKALNTFIAKLGQTPASNDSEKVKEQVAKTKPSETESDLEEINGSLGSAETKLKRKFMSSWKSFIKPLIKKQKKAGELEDLTATEILDKFRKAKHYPEDKFNDAKTAFAEVYKQNTLEKVTKNNIDDYIVAALGLPLNLTRISCKKFVNDIQKRLEKELKEAKLLSQSESLVLFNEFATIPREDQIPYVVRYCRLYEDLFSRLLKSNVDTLVSYRKLNGLRGTKNGDFLVLKYEIRVIASQNSARKFLNYLQDAYKDNRIYVINSISLRNISSNMDNLEIHNGEVKSTDGVESQEEFYEKKNSQQESDSKQVVILLGASDLISMDIKLNYIVYDKPLIEM